MYSHN